MCTAKYFNLFVLRIWNYCRINLNKTKKDKYIKENSRPCGIYSTLKEITYLLPNKLKERGNSPGNILWELFCERNKLDGV